jgi:hypothetical protein
MMVRYIYNILISAAYINELIGIVSRKIDIR